MGTKQYGNSGKNIMNILFFSRLFYPHTGGVEKHVLEISKILIKKGHKVTVVAEKHDKKLKDREILDGINVYRISVKKNWFKKFQVWDWLIKNRILIKNADVIHCHDVFFWYLPFRLLFPFKKAYTTFHGYENYPLKSIQIVMHKIAEKLSYGNICIGKFIEKWYDTKANYISYGGVNIATSDKRPASQRGEQATSRNSAIFVGRLDEQTGIKTYVNAVKLIRKKIPDFKFEIIGDGKFRKEIERDFKVLGFQKNPEKYFSKYNFAFVSRYLSILEAMANKKLVFAVYDNPLKEDYLKTTPFAKLINVVSSGDELARKVLYFRKNHKQEEIMINKAFEWAKKQTWEKITNIYLALWNKKF